MENVFEEKNNSGEVQEKGSAQIAKVEEGQNSIVSVVDLNANNVTDLEKQLNEAVAAPFELTDGYWTPEKMGESKKLILKEIKLMKFVAQSGEEVELETACLVEITNGIAKNVNNAAWRLVKSLKNFNSGSAFLITYLGKKKNSSNQNMSDDFSIKPLMITVK